MASYAVAEVVALPVRSKADLADDIDALARPADISQLERARNPAQVRQGMEEFELDAMVTPRGTRASLFETTRHSLDRETAERLLSPAILAEVMRSSTSVILRVK